MSRATQKQKSYIRYINRKLGIDDKESEEILNSITTFEEADLYIKKNLPLIKVAQLDFVDFKKIYKKLIEKIKKIFSRDAQENSII